MLPTLPRLAQANLPSTPFKRSQLGLFHGQLKISGNSIPHSKQKTKRTFLPNVQSKRLASDALQKKVRVKLTTSALKTINKYGGVDQYVLRTSSELLGWEGMRLRVAVKDALAEAHKRHHAPSKYAGVEERVELAVQAAIAAAREQDLPITKKKRTNLGALAAKAGAVVGLAKS